MLKTAKAFSIVSIVLSAFLLGSAVFFATLLIGLVGGIPEDVDGPAIFAGAIFSFLFGIICLVLGVSSLVISIMTIVYINKRQTSTFIALGIVNILFASPVSGILLLCCKEKTEKENTLKYLKEHTDKDGCLVKE